MHPSMKIWLENVKFPTIFVGILNIYKQDKVHAQQTMILMFMNKINFMLMQLIGLSIIFFVTLRPIINKDRCRKKVQPGVGF